MRNITNVFNAAGLLLKGRLYVNLTFVSLKGNVSLTSNHDALLFQTFHGSLLHVENQPSLSMLVGKSLRGPIPANLASHCSPPAHPSPGSAPSFSSNAASSLLLLCLLLSQPGTPVLICSGCLLGLLHVLVPPPLRGLLGPPAGEDCRSPPQACPSSCLKASLFRAPIGSDEAWDRWFIIICLSYEDVNSTKGQACGGNSINELTSPH